MPAQLARERARYADWGATGCAFVFVLVLAISAYWDPSIRVLHVFESLPYLVAGALCLKQSKFGYAVGIVSGAFWLWMAGFLTTFVRNGFERLNMLVRTGIVDRPDVLIAVPAALSTAGLLAFAAVGYLSFPNKSKRDAIPMALAIVGIPAFFLLIFWAFAPQYLAMFQRD